MKQIYLTIFIILSVFFNQALAQKKEKAVKKKRNVTVGFHLNPIIPNNFVQKVNFDEVINNVSFNVKQKPSYYGGMEIRYDFHKRFAIQSGINYTKRVFELSITDSSINETSKFKFIGYEIPVMGLVYTRVGEHIYFNNAFGFSFDFFPTDIYTKGVYYKHLTERSYWAQVALLASTGLEFRTPKKGYFYLGASYHRLFSDIMRTNIQFENSVKNETANFKISGSYFAINIKYFFPPKND